MDGYNIINAWPNLVKLKDENLEHARDKLIEILQNYAAFKKIDVIVVFDAHLSRSKTRTYFLENRVEVIYSKKGETADMVIEKLIDCMPPRSKIFVATSDWAEQRIILGKGALRMPARELLLKVQETEKNIKKCIDNNRKKQDNVLETYLRDNIRKKLEELRQKRS